MTFTTFNRVAFILVILIQTSCVAVVAGGVAGGYYLGKDERPVDQIARDAQTTARVKSALIRNDDIRALDINVDTYEDEVILYGHVENVRERNLAIAIASSTKGVKGVDSKLNVTPVIVDDISE